MKTEAVSNKWHKDGILLLSRKQYFSVRNMFFYPLQSLGLYEHNLFKAFNVCDNHNRYQTDCYNIMPKDYRDVICSMCCEHLR